MNRERHINDSKKCLGVYLLRCSGHTHPRAVEHICAFLTFIFPDRGNTLRFSSVPAVSQMVGKSPTSFWKNHVWWCGILERGASTSSTRWERGHEVPSFRRCRCDRQQHKCSTLWGKIEWITAVKFRKGKMEPFGAEKQVTLFWVYRWSFLEEGESVWPSS